jgi:hypothetical protein
MHLVRCPTQRWASHWTAAQRDDREADVPAATLPQWAFEKLADTKYGVIPLRYRQVRVLQADRRACL